MTEEDYFRKNYPDSCYGDKPLSPHWDFFQDGVEFGERESEKKIEELEAKYYSVSEIAHHRGMCCISALRENRELEQENKVLAQNLEDTEIVNKALEKENAELKDDNKVMADNYLKMEQMFYDNLTKATDIIKNLMVYVPVDLKEYEEAKQFISEVEK